MSINFGVRWADNTKDLARNLKEGLVQIEATKASVTKMVEALSGDKLIASAHRMAAAIQQIGGATKLTAAEQLRANTLIEKAIEKYALLGKAAPQALHDLAAATRQVQEPTEAYGVSFGKLVGSFITAQAVIGAVTGLFRGAVGVVQDSVKAASDAEKAHVQLVAALRAQGTAVPSVIAAYTGYAEALQRTTVFQDDAIEGAIALMVQIGNVMPRDMEKALKATTDLASGLGIDLETATRMVAKAAEGNTTALRKAGVVMDETGGKTHSFGEVLDAITAKFGGQAEAIAGTYQGRLQQLGNTWNNLEESIGRVITQNTTLLTAFGLINQALATNTGELNTNSTANEIVSAAVIGVAKAFVIVIDALDILQATYSGLVVAGNLLGRSFVNIGIFALDAATAVLTANRYLNPTSWLATEEALRQVGAATDFLKGAVNRLNIESAQQATSSVQMSVKLQTLKAGIVNYTGELEKTRGKTTALKDATDESVDAWTRQTKAVGEGAKASKAAAQEQAELAKTIADAWEWTVKYVAAQVAAVEGTQDLKLKTLDLVAAFKLLGTELELLEESFTAVASGPLVDAVDKVVAGVEKIPPPVKEASFDLSQLSQAFANLAQVSGGSLGTVLKAVGTVTTTLNAMQQALKAVDATSKGTWQNMAAGATLAMTFVGAWFAVLQAMWAKEDAHALKVMQDYADLHKLQWDLQQSTSALLKLYLSTGRTAADFWKDMATLQANAGEETHDAASELERLRRIQLGVNAALAAQQRLQDLTAAGWDELNELIKQYKFTEEELGPALQQQHIVEQATAIWRAFRLLTSAGIDTNIVLQHMAGDINEVVRNAQRFGLALPSALRPIIEAMARAGLLTDQFGNAITDVNTLSFDDDLNRGINNMVDALDELIHLIKDFLGIFDMRGPATGVPGVIHKMATAFDDVRRSIEETIGAAGRFNQAMGSLKMPVFPSQPETPPQESGNLLIFTPRAKSQTAVVSEQEVQRTNQQSAAAAGEPQIGTYIDLQHAVAYDNRAFQQLVAEAMPPVILRDENGVRRSIKRAAQG